MSNPLNDIINKVSSDFFRTLEEQTVAAYAQAHQLTVSRYALPEQRGMLGQNRHAFCENAFRSAAKDSGLEIHAVETSPRGGNYSWVNCNGVYILRANIQQHCGTPRPSKFRKGWAAVNKWLECPQLDLLQDTPPPPKDKLCAMLVISAYKTKENKPSVPAFIGLGVPDSDLSTWRALKPINEILGMYNDQDTKNHKTQESTIIVKDKAIPRLKKRENE